MAKEFTWSIDAEKENRQEVEDWFNYFYSRLRETQPERCDIEGIRFSEKEQKYKATIFYKPGKDSENWDARVDIREAFIEEFGKTRGWGIPEEDCEKLMAKIFDNTVSTDEPTAKERFKEEYDWEEMPDREGLQSQHGIVGYVDDLEEAIPNVPASDFNEEDLDKVEMTLEHDPEDPFETETLDVYVYTNGEWASVFKKEIVDRAEETMGFGVEETITGTNHGDNWPIAAEVDGGDGYALIAPRIPNEDMRRQIEEKLEE